MDQSEDTIMQGKEELQGGRGGGGGGGRPT